MLRTIAIAGLMLAFAVAYGGATEIITPFDLVEPAAADPFCGGGGPGEGCYCPGGIGLPGKDPLIPINC